MAIPMRVLEPPIRFFTDGFSRFTQIFHYTVSSESPFFWEDDCLLVYVRSGKGRILVNQTVYHLEPGYFGILHSYHVFRFESSPLTPLDLQLLAYPYPEMVLMDFTPPSSAADFRISVTGSVFVPLSAAQQRTVETLLNAFQEELDSPDNITPLLRNCLFLQMRDLHHRKQKESAAPVSLLCNDIFFYIAAHSFENLTIRRVADEFSLSTAAVNQELRLICGGNFSTVLNHARLSNAYSMMLRSNISFSALAKQAGFPSESSFYRIFHEAYRMTPQQYRTQLLRYLGGSSRSADDRLLEIESYVLKNCRSPITCESCSRELFLPSETINQVLQMKYGEGANFRRFLTEMRLRYAEGFLTMTDLPVCDVAVDTGFNSIHTFIRLYKQRYGKTPSEYRKEKGASR